MEQKTSKRNPRYHLSIWASLLIIYCLLFTYRSTNIGFALTMAVVYTLVSASTIFVAWYRLIPRYHDKGKGTKFAVTLISWLLFDALLVVAFMLIALGLWPGIIANDVSMSLGNAGMLVALMWMMVVAWVLIIISQNQKVKDLEAANIRAQLSESESLRKQLELEQLKSQLQPHFLFNTLNTIYGAALKKADHTPEMIMELSAMLDYGLYHASKTLVPLEDEIAHVERYLNLEKKRFRDGLKIDFQKTGDFTLTTLPPMLLMPLVENAIKHGKVVNEVLSIQIELSVDTNQLVFTVTNPAEPSEKTEGIGLANLRKRLESLFPDMHRLQIDAKDDNFTATLRLTLAAKQI